MTNPSLLNLVKDKQWQEVILKCKSASLKDLLETDPTHFHQTSLHVAVKFKAPINVMQYLICPQTARQKESHTGYLPLHYAIRYRLPLKIVRLLVDAYEEGLLTRVGTDSLTCLHLACYFNTSSTVIHHLLATEPLLAKLKTRQNATALHITCRRPNINPKIVKSLLKIYPSAATLSMKGKWTPLHLAIFHEAPYEVLVALVSASPDMIHSTTSSSGQTPLGLYWSNNAVFSTDIVSLLLDPISELHDDRVDYRNRHYYDEGLVHKALKFPQKIPNVLKFVLDIYPSHSKYRDVEGRLPLHVAIELKNMVEKDAWKKIFNRYPYAISKFTLKNHLYPFMIASLQNDLCLTYELIALAPDLLEQNGNENFDTKANN